MISTDWLILVATVSLGVGIDRIIKILGRIENLLGIIAHYDRKNDPLL